MIPICDPRTAPIGADWIDTLGRRHSPNPQGTTLCRHLTTDGSLAIVAQCPRCACSLCAACDAGESYCPECEEWVDGRWGAAEVAAELDISVRRVEQVALRRGIGRRVGGRLIFTAPDVARMRVRTPGRPRTTARVE